MFIGNTTITKFNEFRYFTKSTNLGRMFQNCTSLEEVDLSNITNVYGNANLENTLIKVLNLPNLQTISAHEVFRSSSNLEEVINLGTLQSLHVNTYDRMFGQCYNLKKVVLPETLLDLGQYTFLQCRALEEINIPQGLTTIRNQVFYETPSLNKVMYFPNVISCGHSVFSGNGDSISAVRYVYFPKLPRTYDGMIISTGRYTWGFMTTEWNRKSFFNVLYFKDISIFGRCSFYNGTIRNLVVNNTTVPQLGDGTNFGYSTSLNDSTPDLTNVPTQATDIFCGVISITNIYVPDSAVTDYQNDSAWSSVANKIKPLSTMNKVATEEEFNTLSESAKMDTLIEEYM